MLPNQKEKSQTKLVLALIVIVCALVVMTHWPVLSTKVLFFDDDQYLTGNILVQNPSWKSARRFITEILEPSTVEGYYQPLTMISLMADYAMGGRENYFTPFHRTSLMLHAANTALIIMFLYLLFGHIWSAAAVGLLFGLHPMVIEPIAWIGERKTLLAAFFALWSLIFYVRFTLTANWKLFAACIITYLLALMSKPTSLPLPLLMLLLDYWPLKRLKPKAVLEKIPLLVIGIIFAVITYISQNRTAAVTSPNEYGFAHIILVLCHNIIFYLSKIVWPINLSPFYAFPKPLALSDTMILTGLIGTCTLIPLLLVSLRWTKGLLAGWLVFFVAIFPTMGVVGFTNVIARDNYAYLPAVGLLMVLASFLVWLYKTGSRIKYLFSRLALVAIVLIAAFEVVATRQQLILWRDTVSICEHVLSLTPDVAEVHNRLGTALKFQGKISEAIDHHHKALRINPKSVIALNNLGTALRLQGKLDEAIGYYNRAILVDPRSAEVHNNLANALSQEKKYDRAVTCYRKAIEINPDYLKAHHNLAITFQAMGRFNEALSHYNYSLKLKSNFAPAHYNLGSLLQLLGKNEEAVKHYREALRIDPDFAKAHNNLASILIMRVQFDQALSHFQRAAALKPNYITSLNGIARILATNPNPKKRNVELAIQTAERTAELTNYNNIGVLNTLEIAYAVAGQFENAIKTGQREIDLASAAGNEKLVNQIRERQIRYQKSKP